MSKLVAFGVLFSISFFSLVAFVSANHNYPRSIAPVPVHAFTPASSSSISSATRRIITETLPSVADLALQIPETIQAIPGEMTVYTLTIRNQGPAQATGVVLKHVFAKEVTPVSIQPTEPWCDRHERSTRCGIGDVRPADMTSITIDLSVGGRHTQVTNTQLAGVTLDLSTPICTIDLSQSSVNCRLSTLLAGADAQIRINADLDAQITGTLVNSATVTANESDPNLSNNHATVTLTVDTSARVIVPPLLTFSDLVIQAEGPSNVIAGQPFTYTYTITNHGELDATGIHFEDALPSTANFYSVMPGLPKCDQRGNDVTCSFYEPDSGEIITFTLAITGTFGQPLRVTPDPLIPGLPICTILKERTWLRIVNCELGTLKRGKSTQVQLGFVAIGLQEHVLTNGAFVRARETELNSGDNAITSTIAVSVRSDLQIRSALSGTATVGKPFSYTLTIANNGPSDADGIILTDALPMHTRFVSTILSPGDDCRQEQKDATLNVVFCRLKPMRGGTTTAVTLILAVDEPITKSMVHSAKVTSDQVDPNPSNNELIESIPLGMLSFRAEREISILRIRDFSSAQTASSK